MQKSVEECETKGDDGKELEVEGLKVGMLKKRTKHGWPRGAGGTDPGKYCEPRVAEWEELGYTPGVFVRVANTGLTGYGK
jgi:hypothetical protein